MLKILPLSGSLRAHSFNTTLLDAQGVLIDPTLKNLLQNYMHGLINFIHADKKEQTNSCLS